MRIQCQSANAEKQQPNCDSEAEYIITYDDYDDKDNIVTKIVGSCMNCLERLPGFDLGNIGMLSKYENYQLLPINEVNKIQVNTKNISCGVKLCNETSIFAQIGVIKCGSIGFYFLFYRCSEHKMKNDKNWKNLRIIRI